MQPPRLTLFLLPPQLIRTTLFVPPPPCLVRITAALPRLVRLTADVAKSYNPANAAKTYNPTNAAKSYQTHRRLDLFVTHPPRLSRLAAALPCLSVSPPTPPKIIGPPPRSSRRLLASPPPTSSSRRRLACLSVLPCRRLKLSARSLLPSPPSKIISPPPS